VLEVALYETGHFTLAPGPCPGSICASGDRLDDLYALALWFPPYLLSSHLVAWGWFEGSGLSTSRVPTVWAGAGDGGTYLVLARGCFKRDDMAGVELLIIRPVHG
jgi:hypothetical protein